MKKINSKVSIVGAGAVGSTLAQRVLEGGLTGEVVLLDVLKNVAVGKSFDLLDAAPMLGHEGEIIGTDDYKEIAGSDIVVITAGFPRKPGMTREELIAKNKNIVKEASEKIKVYAPSSIVIIVTNPLDAMTYVAYKTTGFKREHVFGMAGVLDSSRFIHLIAHELKVSRSSVETYILGSHGDTMVPLLSHTRVSGKPITELLSKEAIGRIVKRTCERGAEIVNLFGTGSAYYSPSAGTLKMIDAILNNSKQILVVSAYLEGEYSLSDICIGVPCKIGRSGIEEIVKLELSKDEEETFRKSARAIKSSIEAL